MQKIHPSITYEKNWLLLLKESMGDMHFRGAPFYQRKKSEVLTWSIRVREDLITHAKPLDLPQLEGGGGGIKSHRDSFSYAMKLLKEKNDRKSKIWLTRCRPSKGRRCIPDVDMEVHVETYLNVDLSSSAQVKIQVKFNFELFWRKKSNFWVSMV